MITQLLMAKPGMAHNMHMFQWSYSSIPMRISLQHRMFVHVWFQRSRYYSDAAGDDFQIKWLKFIADSRMIRYYQVLRRLSLKVFLLGYNGGTLLFLKKMPFLFVATMCSLFYLLCLKLGFMAFLISFLSQVMILLGGRALFYLLINRGCPGFLASAIAFFVRIVISNEAPPSLGKMVLPAETEAGESSNSESWRKYLSSDKEGKAESDASTAQNQATGRNDAGPSSVEQPAPSSTGALPQGDGGAQTLDREIEDPEKEKKIVNFCFFIQKQKREGNEPFNEVRDQLVLLLADKENFLIILLFLPLSSKVPLAYHNFVPLVYVMLFIRPFPRL